MDCWREAEEQAKQEGHMGIVEEPSWKQNRAEHGTGDVSYLGKHEKNKKRKSEGREGDAKREARGEGASY